jgi:uncharacterized membrane protein HdeD (DUF308 family)/predicted flap endonuclease-1-like 5' DNA nuclease
MTTQNSTANEYHGVPWWLVLVEGIAAILVGILLFARPAATIIVLIQFLGIYWLITGIFSIISLIWDRSAWGWKLVSGVLGILAGILIVQNPLWSTLLVPTSLAIVLGVTGLIIGILQLMKALNGGGWGIGVLGVLSILLGLLLIARPAIAALSLPWVLGFLLIAGGILAIFGAFQLRRLAREAHEAKALATRSAAREVAPVSSVPYQPADSAGYAASSAAAGVYAAQPAGERVSNLPIDEAGSTSGAVEAVGEPVDEPPDGVIAAAGQVVDQAFAKAGEAVEEAAATAGEPASELLTGNVDLADPTEVAKFKYALEYVEGIGQVYAERLKAIGLVTCLDLLRAGATRKGREETAEKSGISAKLILEWVNHVDLYRIKGVGSEFADLLEAAGVDTVMELAQRNPGNLLAAMDRVNVDKKLVRKMPNSAQVEDWVSQAKNLPRVVTY